MTITREVALFLILAAVPALAQERKALPAHTIIFVCEHGSAKSVVAAAHFNRLAKEKGLPHRAITRGTNPDQEIPAIIRRGLAADGLDVTGSIPRLIAPDEIRDGERVITFACALPGKPSASAPKFADWNDIPNLSENYERGRQTIVAHLNELLKSLVVK